MACNIITQQLIYTLKQTIRTKVKILQHNGLRQMLTVFFRRT